MIYLLCSTIRPTVFKNTHSYWMANVDNNDNIITKVVVDKKQHQDDLSEFDTMLYLGTNVGLTKPLTQLTQSLEGLNDSDIIVVMSDDFFPPKHWDTLLEQWYTGFTGALNVFDGGPPEVQTSIITIPIMDFATLKKLNGVIYHPAYNHMYSDNELFDNLNELGLMKTLDKNPNHIFEHRHWTVGKRPRDQQDIILGNISIGTDKGTYIARKGIKLKDRIKYDAPVPIILSILICTLTYRTKTLAQLTKVLEPQLNSNVEVLIDCDDGTMSIGEKRNNLLQRATGKYAVYIDDDDLVSEDYVSLIIRAAKYGSDCIGIQGTITTNGVDPKLFIHSIRNTRWETVNGVHLRYPNHLNPIKLDIAKSVGFDTRLNRFEDRAYSDNIKGLLKSETYIGKSIYEYKFETRNKSYM